MPRNTNVKVAPETWTQITDADVTSITFQNKSGHDLLVKGAVGAVAPSDANGAIEYGAMQGERNSALADLFPGLSATRVYVYSAFGAVVMVSHA